MNARGRTIDALFRAGHSVDANLEEAASSDLVDTVNDGCGNLGELVGWAE